MGCSCLNKLQNKLNNLIHKLKPQQVNRSSITVADESVISQRQLVDEIVKEKRCADMAVVCQQLSKSFGKNRVLVQIDMCIEK